MAEKVLLSVSAKNLKIKLRAAKHWRLTDSRSASDYIWKAVGQAIKRDLRSEIDNIDKSINLPSDIMGDIDTWMLAITDMSEDDIELFLSRLRQLTRLVEKKKIGMIL